MDNDQPTSNESTDSSRREFLKKGAATTGVVALGVSGASPAAAQGQEDVLTFFDDFEPGQTFRVVAQLPQDITVTLLQLPNGNTVPEISQPDDYNGYAIRPTTGNNQSSGATYLFTTGTLTVGNRYRFGTTSNVFSTQLSLISTTVNRQGGDGGGGGGS